MSVFIVNVTDRDRKNPSKSLVLKDTDTFESWKEKVKTKLKIDYEIEKFHCIENKIIIDDDELLKDFFSRVALYSQTTTLVALSADDEYKDEEEGEEQGTEEEKSNPPDAKFNTSLLKSETKQKPMQQQKPDTKTLEGIRSKVDTTIHSDEAQEERKNEDEVENKEAELLRRERELQEKLSRAQRGKEMRRNEIAELEHKIFSAELRKAKIAKKLNELKKAEQVDICFMVDCTESMGLYIGETIRAVHCVMDRMLKKFPDFKLRCAFVGYRDHGDYDRTTIFPFTSDTNEFKKYVASVRAEGGSDQCEDVFGGLEVVNSLDWSQMTRILFHVGDAPCHGRRFHLNAEDNYPDGCPRGLQIEDLMRGIAEKNIDYYFVQINQTTEKMIDEFNRELLNQQGRQIKRVMLARVDAFLDNFAASVATSIMNSKSMSMHDAHGKALKDYRLNTAPIPWMDLLHFQEFTADLFEPRFNCLRLNDIRQSTVSFEKRKNKVWMARKPFAKGGLRFAFAGFIGAKPSMANRVVIKESLFLDNKYNIADYYKNMIEIQVIAKFMADEFMKVVPPSHVDKKLRFIDVFMLKSDTTGKFHSIETFIEAEFLKWTTNTGMLNAEVESAASLAAFSHWTYQASDEYLLVTDLQGFCIGDTFMLTDPAITCVDDPDRFSSTNLGIKGIKTFFQSHECNSVCHALGLQKHRFQNVESKF